MSQMDDMLRMLGAMGKRVENEGMNQQKRAPDPSEMSTPQGRRPSTGMVVYSSNTAVEKLGRGRKSRQLEEAERQRRWELKQLLVRAQLIKQGLAVSNLQSHMLLDGFVAKVNDLFYNTERLEEHNVIMADFMLRSIERVISGIGAVDDVLPGRLAEYL